MRTPVRNQIRIRFARCSSFPRVILVTGTPGVGKTTFARKLAKRRGARLIELGKLVAAKKLVYGEDPLRKTKIADLRDVRQAARNTISNSRNEVVVEGHLSHLVFQRAEVRLVFVLRCDPRRLTRRLARKGWNRRKIEENVLAEVLDVCLAESINRFGLGKIAELDTTWWGPNRMVEYAAEILDGKERPQLAGTDWLGTLAEAGTLKRKLERWSRNATR